ncbi:MAG TPA: pyruvate dehydrogenase (acetyl-transferring) E1 component subunit alpha [Kofleriaceae bacterium]|nr:pyruvate dehydrogenase (acetyl-transferring) E1 component subunit alpha [Kofleriaceae bacterium]
MTPTRDQALAMLRSMIRIRRLEERCAEDYAAGKIRGFLHLYIGEEAIAAGIIPALAAKDAIVGTYREHGHALLRGVAAEQIMAEMYGKSGGCARGRGGSMHLFSREHRFYGGHAIVGGGLPISLGIALADKVRGTGAITCVFFGDGAVAEGEFHESMNLAALWKLPVLFVCENNQYAMGTALVREHAEPELYKLAASHRVGAERIDGMDVVAVAEAAGQAVERVRETAAPWFIECSTYRFRAHSMFDPELYRDKAEVELWKQRDPITLLVKRMAGVVTEADIAAIESGADDEIARACAFAEASPLEPVAELLRDVRASGEGT